MIDETFKLVTELFPMIIMLGGFLFIAEFGFWIIFTEVPNALDRVRKKYE